MSEKSSMPAELILRTREMIRRGESQRRIVNRVPHNVDWDTITLECGHERLLLEHISRVDQLRCNECEEEWMRRQGE